MDSTREKRWRQTKQKHNTICVGHYYAQANTNNVNKTWAIPQTNGEIVTDTTTRNSEGRHIKQTSILNCENLLKYPSSQFDQFYDNI
jgi:hypothetical protein